MKSIAISSGKGGVGKTTVAINLGLALGLLGKRVLLVDGDLGLANLDILAGVAVQRTLREAIDESAALDSLLIEIGKNVELLPASSGILRLERLSRSERDELAHKLRELGSRFDVMLCDTGAGMTENVLFFDSFADEVLLVTTPEPTAVTDTYALIKVLETQKQVSAISLLVNKVASAAEGLDVHAKLSGVCEKFLGRSLGFAGQIWKDSAAEQAARTRTPFVIGNRTSAASSGVQALASRFDQVFRKAG